MSIRDEIIAACVAALVGDIKGETETPASTPPTRPDPRINKPVIVRANKAGVYVGRLIGFDGGKDCPILDVGSRQIHYWARGGSVASLAEHGLQGDGHRVTGPATGEAWFGPGAEVVQIVQIKDEATYQTFLDAAVWHGE